MNIKFKLEILLLGVIMLASSISCNDIESLEVNAPKIPVDTEALTVYKSSLFSRPIVMGYLNNWGATNGVMLAATPDSLDVAIVSPIKNEITPAQAKDLEIVQTEKQTKVLIRTNLEEIAKEYATRFKKEGVVKRKELIASWTEDNMPTAEEQAMLIQKLEEELLKTLSDAAVKNATSQVTLVLKNIEEFGFDGLCLKLPETPFFAEEALVKLLDMVVAKCGGTSAPFLAIETPFEGARAQIEKATWVIYSKKTIEKRLSDFTNEAVVWNKNRYIPSVDLNDKTNNKGYLDSKIFSPTAPVSRELDVINWQANNRAGVAYMNIEKDANFNADARTNYPQLKKLINLIGLTK